MNAVVYILGTSLEMKIIYFIFFIINVKSDFFSKIYEK